MPIIGLIGGIAPESTIAYYRLLVAGHRERYAGRYPRIVIDSIDLEQLVARVGAGELARLTDELAIEVGRLAAAGAEIAAFASNTPHIVFDEVAARSPIPLVSIVEATAAHAAARGFERVGLLGTRSTMEAGFYPRIFGGRGITVVAPEPDDRDYAHGVYVRELVNGSYLPGTRAGLLAVIERLRERSGVQAVVLGGTELPLALAGATAAVPLLDTAAIHVEEILRRAGPAD